MLGLALGSVVLALLNLQATASQVPLVAPSSENTDYTFKWPIRKVAVIGAGVGGIISYREFLEAGFDVHVFERDKVPGGNWHYTDEVPDKAPIPNAESTIGDYVPSLPPQGAKFPYEQVYSGDEFAKLARSHRGPTPVWETMTAGPAPDMTIDRFPWPVGTPWNLSNSQISGYLRAFSSFNGANSNDNNPRFSYNTRVELVEKRFDEEGKEVGWTLTLKTLTQAGPDSCKAVWTKQDFDAVVVATGRFNAPNMPNIPGLVEWDKAFPDSLIHSRQYRRSEPYTNKTVLVVGASSSGGQISRDLAPNADKVFTSIRPDKSGVLHGTIRFLLEGPLPPNIEVVGEIKRFLPPTSSMATSGIELTNGTIFTGVDAVIFATGFRYSFPFLPQYHNPSVGPKEKGPSNLPQPIVTDGSHLRNLYLDIFYIEEPTIGFVNMNIGMQPFTYAEYTSVALSKVWSNKAKIPSTPGLGRWNEKHREEYGYGRHYQYLGVGRTDKMIRFFMGWLNEAASKYGGRQVDGQSPDREEALRFWLLARYGDANVGISSACAKLALDVAQCEKARVDVRDLVFNDDW